MTVVKLTYFKPWSGKFYATGEYTSAHAHLFEIVAEVHARALDRRLPDLCEGHGPFVVHVLVPNAPPAIVGLDEAATYVMELRGQAPPTPAELEWAYHATLYGGGQPPPLTRADLESMFQLAPGAEEPG